jgi:hypothetical protein
MKRWRAPKAKPGELKIAWGKLPHDDPDLVFCWGAGCSKRDGNLLHYIFSGKRQRMVYGEDREKAGGFPVVFDPSALEELEARGYDLTTLKFSIQKKAETPTAL